MDFIERWLGISLDGGNGTFEASLVLAMLVVGCVLLLRHKARIVAVPERT